MRMYKEINRVIKNYVLLRYNDENYEWKNVYEFKNYLADLLNILKKNELVSDYAFSPGEKMEGSEMIKFYLTYSIPDDKNEFTLNFIANIN